MNRLADVPILMAQHLLDRLQAASIDATMTPVTGMTAIAKLQGVPHTSRWTVWVAEEEDLPPAQQVLREVLAEYAPSEVVCDKCGYDLRGHRASDRCPECGDPFRARPRDVQCHACGEPVPEHFAICWNCGAPREPS